VEKGLSYATREVLLKANAQSMPTYPMSCFKLSLAVCCKLTLAVSNYWWGSLLDNHKIHWLCWEKLTRSKSQGGMGFRDFTLFNQAMLGNIRMEANHEARLVVCTGTEGEVFP
jgi:hypothetical protein